MWLGSPSDQRGLRYPNQKTLRQITQPTAEQRAYEYGGKSAHGNEVKKPAFTRSGMGLLHELEGDQGNKDAIDGICHAQSEENKKEWAQVWGWGGR